MTEGAADETPPKGLMEFRFFLGEKRGWRNFCCCLLCLIIPLPGWLVILGYFAEVFDGLLDDPDESAYPDFDFDRLGKYLFRGLFPFLAQLVFVGLPKNLLVKKGIGAEIQQQFQAISRFWSLEFPTMRKNGDFPRPTSFLPLRRA